MKEACRGCEFGHGSRVITERWASGGAAERRAGPRTGTIRMLPFSFAGTSVDYWPKWWTSGESSLFDFLHAMLLTSFFRSPYSFASRCCCCLLLLPLRAPGADAAAQDASCWFAGSLVRWVRRPLMQAAAAAPHRWELVECSIANLVQ